MGRSPKETILEWVKAFNQRDAKAAAALYHEDAVDHQVAAGEPVRGRQAILKNAEDFFREFPDSYTHVENMLESGQWIGLEWSGGGTSRSTGKSFQLRGCGFFHIIDGKIKFQRGYWDKHTWFSQVGFTIS